MGRAVAFASAVNDWQIAEWLDKEPRLRASIVVPVQLPELAARESDRVGDHPGVRLYVQVQDVPRSLELAEALGGKRVREPFSNAGGVTLGLILDPEGNPIVLVQQ